MNKPDSIFGINTLPDYFRLCERFVADLEAEKSDFGRAYPAILALNHLTDWLRHKLTSEQRTDLSLSLTNEGSPLQCDFEKRNSDLKFLREIANGAKHLQPKKSTEKVAGYGRGPYGVGPYGEPYLLIDRGADLTGASRWITADKLCRSVLEWWSSQLGEIVQEARRSAP